MKQTDRVARYRHRLHHGKLPFISRSVLLSTERQAACLLAALKRKEYIHNGDDLNTTISRYLQGDDDGLPPETPLPRSLRL